MGRCSAKDDKVYPYPTLSDECQKNKSALAHDINVLHPKKRKPTDVCFFNIFAFFLVILCSLIAYCIYHGDIGRVIHGYDNCGTVCGDTHRAKELQDCYRTMDQRNFGSYHLVYYRAGETKLYDRICTNNCNHYKGYKEFLNRCLPSSEQTVIDNFFTKTGIKDFFVEVCEDFAIYWKVFCYMCVLSLVISLGYLVLLPFLAGILVWIILLGVVCACLAATIYLWLSWKELKDTQQIDSEIDKREVWSYLGMAGASSCITIAVILVICVMIKRIKLVVQLFEEAGKAISSIPALLFEPLLTFISIISIICLWIYFSLWISSAGYLTEKRSNVYYYKKDSFMEAAKFLNFFGMFWMVQFVIGCQHMVIAGAVSRWYFTREKSRLSNSITESFYNLTRYHLGTVAMGSFLLAMVQVLRLIISAFQKMLENRKNTFIVCLTKICLCFCNCCLWILEHVLNMLTRNAYIVTAIYGHSFYKAGKQAFMHLASNPLRVTAINSVGDFVLFLSKVLVVACTVAISSHFLKNKEGVQHAWVPLVLLGLFSYFISHCFVTVYEMTIDTIFICFCEDCIINDGISKPYFMSRGLMEFVENSNIALDFPRTVPDDNNKKRSQDSSLTEKNNEVRVASL